MKHNQIRSYIHALETLLSSVEEYLALPDETTPQVREMARDALLKNRTEQARKAEKDLGGAS